MSEILLVSLTVLAALAGALALSEWAASHWVRTRAQRRQDLNDEYPLGDPFERNEL